MLTDIELIQLEVENVKENFNLVSERISQYTNPIEVPLLLEKNRKDLEKKLAQLTAKLEELNQKKKLEEVAQQTVTEEFERKKVAKGALGNRTWEKLLTLLPVLAFLVLVVVFFRLENKKNDEKDNSGTISTNADQHAERVDKIKHLIDSLGLKAFYFEKDPASPYTVLDFFDSTKRMHDPILQLTPWPSFIQRYAGMEMSFASLDKILAPDSSMNNKLLFNFNLPPEKSQWNGFSIHLKKIFYENSSDILKANLANWKYYSPLGVDGEKEFIYKHRLSDVIQFQVLK